MNVNWLWDSRLTKKKVREILNDEHHPRFEITAEKLLSRTSDPKVAFDLIDQETFCRKWPSIKKRMRKNRWANDRIRFWQVIYERALDQLRKKGFTVRQENCKQIPPERFQVAQQIRKIRTRLGYTQNDFAKKLGVIQQYVSKVERGQENISLDVLKKIAYALDRHLVIHLVV